MDPWRALMNTVMHFRVPYNVGKSLSSWATGSFSRRTQLHGVRQWVSKVICPKWFYVSHSNRLRIIRTKYIFAAVDKLDLSPCQRLVLGENR
jgi:hypothetical protein